MVLNRRFIKLVSIKRINWILGITYILIFLIGFIIESVFLFEITQEVLITDNEFNYLINFVYGIILGVTGLIALGHLCLWIGYTIGVAKTEESFKKIQ